jgi:hypothetical protein
MHPLQPSPPGVFQQHIPTFFLRDIMPNELLPHNFHTGQAASVARYI